MTHDPSFERLFDAMRAGPPDRLPDRVLDQVFVTTRGSRNLPRWLALLKEPPMRLSDRLAVGSPSARLAVIAGSTLLLAVALAGATIAGASPSPATGLVTAEVEPGVERIISDGAGHDLEERHPDFRYDMDDVHVTPDGTVWLRSSYGDTDNNANPRGALVWALGQPGMYQDSGRYRCRPGTGTDSDTTGVTCWELATGSATRYLAGTQINAVASAPDGTFWAVGADGAENGGLYHITPD